MDERDNFPGKPSGASRPSPLPPTILGMAASLAGSMAKFAASGFNRVAEQTQKLRVDACDQCEYRRENRCMLCGCFFAKKAWLPHEDCPIGKWAS